MRSFRLEVKIGPFAFLCALCPLSIFFTKDRAGKGSEARAGMGLACGLSFYLFFHKRRCENAGQLRTIRYKKMLPLDRRLAYANVENHLHKEKKQQFRMQQQRRQKTK